VSRAEAALARTPGVLSVQHLQLRWSGHRLQGSARIELADTALSEAEEILHRAEHQLRHALPKLDHMLLAPASRR